jgi:hypothetical protein
VRVFFVLAFSLSALYSQTAPQQKQQTVTATGCVTDGVECYRLVDPQDPAKLLYSITRTPKLKIGHAYRITGPVSEIGFCQEGKKILKPEKITEVRLHCAQVSGKPGEKKSE